MMNYIFEVAAAVYAEPHIHVPGWLHDKKNAAVTPFKEVVV